MTVYTARNHEQFKKDMQARNIPVKEVIFRTCTGSKQPAFVLSDEALILLRACVWCTHN
jgi:hypothetical protein